MAENGGEIRIGDRVRITDKDVTGEVINVREFDGRKTFVVQTEKGNQVVVGQRQIERIE